MNDIRKKQIEKGQDDFKYVPNKDTKAFQEVYPFATEAVSAYFSRLDLKDKSLLTVGSSLDQAFNALVLGVRNITVYDINKNVEAFYKIKRDFILNYSRKDLYEKITQVQDVPFSSDLHSYTSVVEMNNYLQSDENYELLRQRLQEDNIEFIRGDIFNCEESLGDKKYDRIVLSNVLQYLDFFAGSSNPYHLLKETFLALDKHLNDEGILQLLYLYSFQKSDLRKNNHAVSSYNLKNVVECLNGYSLELEMFPSFTKQESNDAIVTYTKKRKR